MKTKTTWKTLAGLALAAGAWRKFSEDLPIHAVPPAEVCAYPNLTQRQLDDRLLNLEIDLSNGIITLDQFYAEEKRLNYCRSLLSA